MGSPLEAQWSNILESSKASQEQHSTPLFVLFQGRRGEHALNSCWWCLSGSQVPQGPFSSEQMILACVAGILAQDARVCGVTYAQGQGGEAVRKPPAVAAFRPLSQLMAPGSTWRPLSLQDL
mmetsp:Transcript_5759/g.14306  ORF Transcript_5759/g.14306 Transcript_5759/m.14306 type:complete len:122 (-) Transcript_5759:1503-1868(-)